MPERLLLVVMLFALIALLAAPARAEEKPPVNGYRVSGPYTHGNLTVFLIHGADVLQGRDYLTLQEAMERKGVVVHETGNVNELAVENVSDVPVYVQSGDIVKGGKQDRTIAQDFVVPPKSGRMPIASFCVESGRWQQRAGEEVAAFASSTQPVAGRELKLAAKLHGDQSRVWSSVAKYQDKLGQSVGGSVQAAASPSSFQLTMENAAVGASADEYVTELAPVVEGKDDVIGYAFAVNGQLNSADVYGSGALFRKLWPKLLRSSAVEALAERPADGKHPKGESATAEAVMTCIEDAGRGQAKQTEVGRVELITRETEDNYLFETVDKDGAAKGGYLHRNYITRPEAPSAAP